MQRFITEKKNKTELLLTGEELGNYRMVIMLDTDPALWKGNL